MNVALKLCVAAWFCSVGIGHSELKSIVDEPWDLNGPCQPYIKEFAEASSKMMNCAATYSSPPKVCTYCTEEYIAMKHVENKLHKLKNVFSRDNTTCSSVIFQNYLISYVAEVSYSITENIWFQSRCSSCVIIEWHFEGNKTDYSFHNNTVEFQDKLYTWRRCVSNYTTDLQTNSTLICDKCMNSFNALFEFYWGIYVAPHSEFCLDVETTMNDTMNLWHNVLHCADDREEKQRDWRLLGYSLALLIIIATLFYTGSYVQSEEIQRRLVQYSRLETPSGLRSRLLSSSTIDPNFQSTSAVSVWAR